MQTNVAVQKCTYLPMYIHDPVSDGQTPTAMSSQSWLLAGSIWYSASVCPSSESRAKIRARSPLSLCVYSTPGCRRLAAKPEASLIRTSGTILKFLPRPKTVTLINTSRFYIIKWMNLNVRILLQMFACFDRLFFPLNFSFQP